MVEDRLLEAIRTQLFTDEAAAYITQRVNATLRTQARERRHATADRRRLEGDLREALTELDHIRDAIGRGLTSDLTKQMLDEAEARARRLPADLEAPPRAEIHTIQVLPRLVRDRLADLDRLLTQDVPRTREALRGVWARFCCGRPRRALRLNARDVKTDG